MCNFKCQFCGRKRFTKINKNMSFEKFCRVVNQFPMVRSVTLQGFGEPLMNREIFSMIKYTKETLNAKVLFFSNGSLLSDSVSKRLIQAGLDKIIISYDGVTAEVFEKLRFGAVITKVREGVQSLIETKKRLDATNPIVWFHVTCMKDNLGEWSAILELAEQLGVNGIDYHPLLEIDSANMANNDQLLSNLDVNFIQKAVSELLETKRHVKVEVNIGKELLGFVMDGNLSGIQERGKKDAFLRYCPWAWEGCSVTVDGTIQPCCYAPYFRAVSEDDSFSAKSISLYKEKIDTIWNSSPYRKLRNGIAKGKPIPLCRKCHIILKVSNKGLW